MQAAHASSSGQPRLLLAAAVPLAGAALAYASWWASDRLLTIGPIDRATFGWLVIVPIWLGTPLVTAYAWRALDGRRLTIAATTVGLIVAVVAASLYWLAATETGCHILLRSRAPSEWIMPAAFFGGVVGGGFALVAVASTAVLRRTAWWVALIVGGAAGLALVFVAIMMAVAFIFPAGCNGVL